MAAKNFIIQKLKHISSLFPEMSFKYGINPSTGTHLIQVSPLESYTTNLDYLKAEDEFETSFENNFKDDAIVFISTDSTFDIRQPEFEIVGNRITNTVDDSWLDPVFKTNINDNIDPTTNYALAA
jgi:hypothetical protein